MPGGIVFMLGYRRDHNRVSRRRSAGRSVELALAALISGGALFTGFVTDAASQSAELQHAAMAGGDTRLIASPDRPAGTRAAMAEVLSRSGSLFRILPVSSVLQSDPDTGSVQLTPDISIRAHTHGTALADWSGSALGIEISARTASSPELPPVFVVGGAGRETYMIAPHSPREYSLVPAGSETSLGDAHIGIGVQLNPNVFATVGYVREKRSYRVGSHGWSEEEHFAGIALRARW